MCSVRVSNVCVCRHVIVFSTFSTSYLTLSRWFPFLSLLSSIIIVFDCGSPMDETFDTETGNAFFSAQTFGSVATFTCDSGYMLQGSAFRTCELEGWTGTPPSCGKWNKNIMQLLHDLAHALDQPNMLIDPFLKGTLELSPPP